jgi:hypothetical protein
MTDRSNRGGYDMKIWPHPQHAPLQYPRYVKQTCCVDQVLRANFANFSSTPTALTTECFPSVLEYPCDLVNVSKFEHIDGIGNDPSFRALNRIALITTARRV